MIVAGRFFEHLFTLHVFQVERTQIFFGYEIGGFILIAGHEAVANLTREVVHIRCFVCILVGVCVVVDGYIAIFSLGCIFGSEFQAVSIDSVGQRQFEIYFELQVFFVDFLVAFG